jgi:preprotein translocase subunit SecE
MTYIQESRAELRKVTWPTWDETRALTIAVIAMTLAIALFLGAVDQILNSIVGPLTGIK